MINKAAGSKTAIMKQQQTTARQRARTETMTMTTSESEDIDDEKPRTSKMRQPAQLRMSAEVLRPSRRFAAASSSKVATESSKTEEMAVGTVAREIYYHGLLPRDDVEVFNSSFILSHIILKY